eukprot:788-Pelagococcus_subviridis.AAC.1
MLPTSRADTTASRGASLSSSSMTTTAFSFSSVARSSFEISTTGARSGSSADFFGASPVAAAASASYWRLSMSGMSRERARCSLGAARARGSGALRSRAVDPKIERNRIACYNSTCTQTFFTHPSVSTFDRSPFQLTDELFLAAGKMSCCHDSSRGVSQSVARVVAAAVVDARARRVVVFSSRSRRASLARRRGRVARRRRARVDAARVDPGPPVRGVPNHRRRRRETFGFRRAARPILRAA